MIEHLSGSSMNAYDNDIHSFYTRYVLGEEPVYCENVIKAMEFWKEYEVWLSQWVYKDYDTQKVCEYVIGNYKVYGLFDFYNYDKWEIIECKTKSWWWKEKDIRNSWQFRIYNYRCMYEWFIFKIHQYNKKENECRIEQINREDKTFEQDFINKAQEIERFLKQFNIELKHYDI